MPPNNEKVIKPELPEQEVYKELALYTNLFRASIIVLLVIFALGNITCLILFVLNSFGITSLSDTALCALAATTIAEVSGLLAILFKGITRV